MYIYFIYIYIFIFLLASLFVFLALCGDLINVVSRDFLQLRVVSRKSTTAAMDGGTTLYIYIYICIYIYAAF